jgi:hypothetical protein
MDAIGGLGVDEHLGPSHVSGLTRLQAQNGHDWICPIHMWVTLQSLQPLADYILDNAESG